MLGIEPDNAPPLLPAEVGDDLAALLAAHPLPDGLADADMNQDEIASAFSKTVNTVAKWTKAGMPFVQEGGPGRSYVFRLSHCWAWVQDRDARQRAQERHNAAQVSALQARFLGLDLDEPQAALSPKDRREMAQADLVWNQAARLRRNLVPLDDVTDLCESLLTIMRESWDGLADRLERELSLTPVQVAAVQRAAVDAMNATRARIEDADLAEQGDDDERF